MASQRMEVALALFLVTVIWTGATAQSPADCTQVLISMSPCLTYIQGNSSTGTPTSACCTQLASVVHSNPTCLCEVLNGGGSALGLNINQTQATALPKACNIQTPPASSCNAAASPASSPGKAPGPSTVSGRGSSTVPSTDNGASSSDATSTKLAAPLVFFLLFVASYASTF